MSQHLPHISRGILVLRDGHSLALVRGAGDAQAIVWPGMGSTVRTLHRIRLDGGATSVPQRHDQEAVYFVVSGDGSVVGTSARLALRPRAAVLVPPRAAYTFEASQHGLTLVGGPCPPDPSLYSSPIEDSTIPSQVAPPRVFDAERDGIPLPFIAHDARLVVWPGVGAEVATLAFVRLAAGEENRAHTHEAADDTVVILEGEGSAEDLSAGMTHGFVAGDVVFIPAGTHHRLKADREVPVVSVGGPCPIDPGMLRSEEPLGSSQAAHSSSR